MSISKLAPDADNLKKMLSFAEKPGGMLQNPLDESIKKLDSLSGLGNLSKTLGDLNVGSAGQLGGIADSISAVKSVSSQMFGSVMPTTKSLPDSLTSDPKMAALKDFPVPSMTQIMMTAKGEQAMHEKLGTAGDNPCLPVQKMMEQSMSAAALANKAMPSIPAGVLDDLKALGAKAKELQKAIDDGSADLERTIRAQIDSVTGQLTSALSGIKKVADGVNEFFELRKFLIAQAAQLGADFVVGDILKRFDPTQIG